MRSLSYKHLKNYLDYYNFVCNDIFIETGTHLGVQYFQ